MSILTWENLKLMLCPKCAGKLVRTNMGYRCTNDTPTAYAPCDFKISDERFMEVVRSLYKPSKAEIDATEERNQKWLNEL